MMGSCTRTHTNVHAVSEIGGMTLNTSKVPSISRTLSASVWGGGRTKHFDGHVEDDVLAFDLPHRVASIRPPLHKPPRQRQRRRCERQEHDRHQQGVGHARPGERWR
jgi:hypothetical protein